ncbi:MAG TPA: hypothetical protein VLJ79_04095 [Candidatus Binatia bacterium]|nr:hypothetical protein [Candidatus Binatia bacterium]
MSEFPAVIPANPPQGFGRMRPSAQAGIEKFCFSWIPVALVIANWLGMTPKSFQ